MSAASLIMEPRRAIMGFDVPVAHKPTPFDALDALPVKHQQHETRTYVSGFAVPLVVVSAPDTPAAYTLHGPASKYSTSISKGPAAVVMLPRNESQLGWRGLLEISRNSGASGVMGVRAVPDDMRKDCKLEICCTAHTTPAVRRLVKSVIRGLKACQDPERTKEGMGGTYILCNENGRKVAILKPCDEEPLAPNNPKGYVGRALGDPGWKPTVRVGEAAMREVAACLLDHDNWARVPTSVLVRARHPALCYNNRMSSVRQSSWDLAAQGLAGAVGDPWNSTSSDQGLLPMKLGSLQEFVDHRCDTSEMGPSRFSVRDVHRIGILDIRLFNTDRHAGNMLVRVPRAVDRASTADLLKLGHSHVDSQYELIPIDHGFCLPETLEACYFEWLHWPQTMLPFSEDEMAYIERLDIQADKALLQRELPNLRPECLRVMEVSTTLLKRGATAGLTLYDIASVMTRPCEGGDDEEPSELEKLAAHARSIVDDASLLDSASDEDSTISEGDEACMEDLLVDQREEPQLAHTQPGVATSTAGDRDAVAVVMPMPTPTFGRISGTLLRDSISFGSITNPGFPQPVSLTGLGSHSKRLSPIAAPAPSFDAPNMLVGSAARAASRDVGIFNFDEELAGLGVPQTPTHTACSPGAASSASSALSSMDAFSFHQGLHPMRTTAATTGGAALSAGAVNAPAMDLSICGSSCSSREVIAPIKMASSVCVTDPGAFMLRHLNTRRANQSGRPASTGLPKRGHTKRNKLPQLYPPPVVAFKPESLNDLFRGMDDAMWAHFMRVYGCALDEALRSNKWKQSLARDAPVAMSCPRF